MYYPCERDKITIQVKKKPHHKLNRKRIFSDKVNKKKRNCGAQDASHNGKLAKTKYIVLIFLCSVLSAVTHKDDDKKKLFKALHEHAF